MGFAPTRPPPPAGARARAPAVCSATGDSRVRFQGQRAPREHAVAGGPLRERFGAGPVAPSRPTHGRQDAWPLPEREAEQPVPPPLAPVDPADLSRTVRGVVLAGGADDNPLARHRAMPSAPLAGGMALVDVPISNFLRAGVNKVYVLTQFQSAGLNAHVARAWPPTRFGPPDRAAWVDVLASHQTQASAEWYRGSADALRRCLPELRDEARGVPPPTEYVVCSGAALHALDVAALVAGHRARGADVTVGFHAVGEAAAATKGVARLHASSGRVLKFEERPSPEALAPMRLDPGEAAAAGGAADGGPQYLASMGVYCFSRAALERLLASPELTHIGHHVLPAALAAGMRVHGHVHAGYWRDCGSLRGYYEAALELAAPGAPVAPFVVDGAAAAARAEQLPPAQAHGACRVEGSLLDDGVVLAGATVRRSVLGRRVYVGRGSLVEDSLLLGSPVWTSEAQRAAAAARGERVYGVGDRCVLRRCIVDDDTTIGDGASVVNAGGVREADRAASHGFMIQDGIVVVMRGAVIAPGTVI